MPLLRSRDAMAAPVGFLLGRCMTSLLGVAVGVLLGVAGLQSLDISCVLACLFSLLVHHHFLSPMVGRGGR